MLVHESTAIEAIDLTEVHRIPCTSAARTLFDLARALGPVALDINIDAALRQGLTSVPDLTELLGRLGGRGRRGSQRFRTALADRSPADRLPESPPERLLARFLVAQGLPAPVTQFEIRDGQGRLVARSDLAYPQWAIVIEYDSFQEHVGKGPLVRDAARRNKITRAGFLPLTATHADIADRAAELARTIRQLRDRAA